MTVILKVYYIYGFFGSCLLQILSDSIKLTFVLMTLVYLLHQ